MTTEPDKRYIYKDGVVVDAETAERLGVEDGVEFEHWADPDIVGKVIFGLSPDEAKAVRESVPETE